MAFPTEQAFLDLVHSTSLELEHKDLFLNWVQQVIPRAKPSSVKLTFSNLLASIPDLEDAGYLPLASLSFLLSQYPNHLSAFEIIRYHNQLWLALPDAFKAGQDEHTRSVPKNILSQVKKSIGSISALFHSTSTLPALIDPNSNKSLTHDRLSWFVSNFDLPLNRSISQVSGKPVVAIALANGYLLGIACLAITSYYSAAPLNIAGGAEQFRSDAELANPQCVLVLESDVERLGLLEPWVEQAGIQVLLAIPEADLTFSVRPLSQSPSTTTRCTRPMPNVGDDFALILFTSGTSGTKKVVPITTFALLNGVTCVIDSWGLTTEDSCVNMMPLNHVGGLVRNLFAPVISGGSTILCPAFDSNLFWDILEDGRGTWYYASPSMHMSILAEGGLRQSESARCRLRLVCNAAGGLLPALAVQLRDTFGCTVLPSYGMTECMPISTPPLDYTLDHPGTSGIGCGPDIAILDEQDNLLACHQVGRINVRGGPTFSGYLKGGQLDKSAFNKDGWFDTGDLGSLDQNGYLYLTGRGKEVINRGGELISPFEVEEAITIASQDPDSPLFGLVRQVMAFSAPHEVLQEVVGVALVCSSMHCRPDVRLVQLALKSSLHSPKWPVVVVYMDALPTSNNKIVRIKFGERLNMEPITDNTPLIKKHFEARCPPVNSSLGTKIENTQCKNDLETVLKEVETRLDVCLEAYIGESKHDGTPEVFIAPKSDISNVLTESCIPTNNFEMEFEDHLDGAHSPATLCPTPIIGEIKRCDTPDASHTPRPDISADAIYNIKANLQRCLDGFLFPSSFTYVETPFPRKSSGVVDYEQLHEVLRALKTAQSSPVASETEGKIRNAFAEVLGFDAADITSESDFFSLGGDSLSAGRLLSVLRRDMDIRIPVDQIFGSSRVSDLCDLVNRILLERVEKPESPDTMPIGCTQTYSSTNPLVMMIHLLPITFFFPLKVAFRWILLMYSLSIIGEYWSEPNFAARFVALLAGMFISRSATQVVAPVFGIIMKWIIIGRYKQGMYPMWGPYHTRWWIVHKILLVCGKGIFRHFDWTRLFYYRLLGAKIGKGVTIEKGTTLGEYDLLEIGDNVHLDRCICRPFAVERNTSMYLGKITVGKNSTVGLKSHIAAGSVLPEDTFIGPNSSSYEMDQSDYSDRTQLPSKTHPLLQIFLIFPTQLLITFISSLPWMFGLYGIVMNEPTETTDNVKAVITWWATAHRIGFHYLAQVLNVAIRPFIWFALIVIVKKLMNYFLGVAKPITADKRTSKDNLRSALMSALVPNGSLHSITKLFGTHYEFTSFAVRAMGGKVGRHVYWPGTGPSIQDFDLVDIGDEVVFGSRSHIVTSDSKGSDIVRVGEGAMVADRVVLNPGTIVGDGAVLGSGALIKRNHDCAPSSVWVGNRKGSAICLSGSGPQSSQTQLVSKDKNYSKISVCTTLPSYPVSVHGDTAIELPSYKNFFKGASDSKEALNFTTPTKTKISESITESITEISETPPLASKTPSYGSSTPFGRAYYEGKASYYVFGPVTIFLYSTLITILAEVFWSVGVVSIVMLAGIFDRTNQFDDHQFRPIKIYLMTAALLSGIISTLSVVSLGIVIAAKWLLLGRRKVGNYDWDKSNYCQRWQLFLTIEALRRRCFGGEGVLGMLTGTHFCVLYFRALGAKIGKDCALFAGGRPSLMFTEPDLLTLGDRVSTDDSSLVGHINSRGVFSLNNLSVGNRSALRSGSRLLSGARMGDDTILLEHTLIMAGDVADDGTVYQGWPADEYRKDRLNVLSCK